MRIIGTIVVALGLFATPALAQTQPPQAPQAPDPQAATKPRGERPYRGLFGGTSSSTDPNRGQSLDFTLSTSGDYIDNISSFALPAGASSDAIDPRFSDSYFFSGADLGLSYARRWNHVSLRASSGHDAFYYPNFGELTGVSHSGTFGVTATAGQRFSVNAAQSISYSPFYGMGGMLGVADPGANPFISNPLYGVSQRHNLQLFTNAGADYELTRRTTLIGTYSRQQLRFTDNDASFANQTAGARVARRVARSASVHAGYSVGWGDYGTIYAGGLPVTQHNIDAGADFSRALSKSRQATYGFSTGAVAYSTSLATYYRALLSGYIDADIGRSWMVRGDYRRGLNWLQGFSEPVFADMVTLRTSGYAGTRVNLSFAAAYSNGEPGLTSGTSRVNTYTGSGHVRFALNRFVGVSGQYMYYHYEFGHDYPLPPGLRPSMDRQTVVVGIDLWVPLLR